MGAWLEPNPTPNSALTLTLNLAQAQTLAQTLALDPDPKPNPTPNPHPNPTPNRWEPLGSVPHQWHLGDEIRFVKGQARALGSLVITPDPNLSSASSRARRAP